MQCQLSESLYSALQNPFRSCSRLEKLSPHIRLGKIQVRAVEAAAGCGPERNALWMKLLEQNELWMNLGETLDHLAYLCEIALFSHSRCISYVFGVWMTYVLYTVLVSNMLQNWKDMSGKDICPIFFSGINFKLHAVFMANQAKRYLQYSDGLEEQVHTNILIRMDLSLSFNRQTASWILSVPCTTNVEPQKLY